jgi:hypothetical protein
MSKFFLLFTIAAALSLHPSAVHSEENIKIHLPEKSSVICNEAIGLVKKDLAQRGYFIPWKIWQNRQKDYLYDPHITIDMQHIRDSYYNPPKNRTDTVVFHLSGDMDKLYKLMMSPQLMTALSARIISGCDNVGIVEFAHWWEGVEFVGYFPDHTVRPFTNIGRSDSPHTKMINTPDGSKTLFNWGYFSSD